MWFFVQSAKCFTFRKFLSQRAISHERQRLKRKINLRQSSNLDGDRVHRDYFFSSPRPPGWEHYAGYENILRNRIYLRNYPGFRWISNRVTRTWVIYLRVVRKRPFRRPRINFMEDFRFVYYCHFRKFQKHCKIYFCYLWN